jgi:hypothetical protein
MLLYVDEQQFHREYQQYLHHLTILYNRTVQFESIEIGLNT